MREIPLKTVLHDVPGSATQVPLVYADVLRNILLAPVPGQGISTSDGLRGLDIAGSIRDAVAAKRTSVNLEEAEWGFLNARLESFRWGYFNEAIADLVLAVKKAEKIDPNAARARDTEGPNA